MINTSRILTENKKEIISSFLESKPKRINKKALHLSSNVYCEGLTCLNSYKLVIALNIKQLDSICIMKTYDYFSLTTKNHLKNIKEYLDDNGYIYSIKPFGFFYSKKETFISKIQNMKINKPKKPSWKK